ncbi:MAG: glutathione synthase [Alphaproteobacteria bacterium]|nr:glutathione synthase [Alphaproteobacteria bacterium]
MSLTVAIQMDPIERIDIGGDSTFALALEAQMRGHKLWYYLPKHLIQRDGKISTRAQKLAVREERGNHFTLGDEQPLDLSSVDVVLLRQDPPFDMAYITTTHMLERLPKRVLVVNDPYWVRNSPEKIFVTEFPDLMPPTLISSDPKAIRAFRDEFKDIIVKPLYGNGGHGVFRVREEDENLNAIIEFFAVFVREPLMAQRYVPQVRQGDKRIILVDGEFAGAINRVPAKGEARSNMHVGGRPEKAALTAREQEICRRIGPELRKRGLIFTGIDVIGDYITEINVTSPTGIWEIRRFDGTDTAALIWNAIEARVRERRT